MKGFSDIIRPGLIVSCQLDENEPLYTPQHCSLFAQAAELGGAVGIRGEGIPNLQEIRATTRIPLIGCVRGKFKDGWVLVTPDQTSHTRLARMGMDVIAVDATLRPRPDGSDGPAFIREALTRHPDVPLLADIATYDEGMRAAEAGAGAISTVLFGRTKETVEQAISIEAHLDLVHSLVQATAIPVLAEGFIWSTTDAAAAMEAGAYGVIVGGAITRPRVITQLFAEAVGG